MMGVGKRLFPEWGRSSTGHLLLHWVCPVPGWGWIKGSGIGELRVVGGGLLLQLQMVLME